MCKGNPFHFPFPFGSHHSFHFCPCSHFCHSSCFCFRFCTPTIFYLHNSVLLSLHLLPPSLFFQSAFVCTMHVISDAHRVPRANFCSPTPAPAKNPSCEYRYGFPTDNLMGLTKIIQFMYILIYNIYIKYLIINKYLTKEQALLS